MSCFYGEIFPRQTGKQKAEKEYASTDFGVLSCKHTEVMVAVAQLAVYTVKQRGLNHF